jgi:nicotinate-nucleotide adenylyltransferase
MRIGLFGGSFDPVHNGHLLLADAVRDEAGLDLVLFVPAAQPPHKPDGPRARPGDRLRMVRMAAEGHAGFAVSELELHRGGTSYTVDTLSELSLSTEWRGAEWFVILGADMWADLPNWKNPDDIARMAVLLVMDRTGSGIRNADPALERFRERARFMKTPEIAISSTGIRERVRTGRSIRYWVPPAVEAFIYARGLYRR